MYKIITTPEIHKRVCRDCEFHLRYGVVFGSNFVESNYICQHPDFKDEIPTILDRGDRGKAIKLYSREEPSTPDWCPFLKGGKP